MCVCVLISNIDAHTMVHKETTSMSVAFYVYIVFLKSGLSDSHSHLAAAFALPVRRMLRWRGGCGPPNRVIGTSHWLALSRKHHHNSKSVSSMLGPKHKEEISVLVYPELGKCHSHHKRGGQMLPTTYTQYLLYFILVSKSFYLYLLALGCK